MLLTNILSAFVLGLLTPLSAVCVLPLYPGFLSYLASQISNKVTSKKENKKNLAMFGIIITFGVVLFMFLLGLIFTTILQVSLTRVIGLVSPIAFGFLFLISILLIFNIDFGKLFPKINAPIVKNPKVSALLFGFFFGAIVIPCNPAFIAVLFAKTLLSTNFISNILSFVAFGIGIGFPLLAFSLISFKASSSIIAFLTRHKTLINRSAGIFMLVVSSYYLIFVFRIFG